MSKQSKHEDPAAMLEECELDIDEDISEDLDDDANAITLSDIETSVSCMIATHGPDDVSSVVCSLDAMLDNAISSYNAHVAKGDYSLEYVETMETCITLLRQTLEYVAETAEVYECDDKNMADRLYEYVVDGKFNLRAMESKHNDLFNMFLDMTLSDFDDIITDISTDDTHYDRSDLLSAIYAEICTPQQP